MNPNTIWDFWGPVKGMVYGAVGGAVGAAVTGASAVTVGGALLSGALGGIGVDIVIRGLFDLCCNQQGELENPSEAEFNFEDLINLLAHLSSGGGGGLIGGLSSHPDGAGLAAAIVVASVATLAAEMVRAGCQQMLNHSPGLPRR